MTPAVDHVEAKRRAEYFAANPIIWGVDEPEDILSRAYLSLLSAVEPLLAAAEKATPGDWGVQWDTNVFSNTRLVANTGGHTSNMTDVESENEANAAFIATARNTASALRDLLGPTGGRA